MIPEKRVRRSPIQFVCPNIEREEKSKKIGKKPKLSDLRYDYDFIQIPPKYENSEAITLLYGSIPVMQVENQLYTDFSLLNEFYLYQDIQSIKYDDQQVIRIKSIKRGEARVVRWKTASKRLIKSKIQGDKRWGYILKDFSLSYNKKMSRYIKQAQKTSSKGNNKDFSDIKTEEDFKVERKNTISESPCIQLKTRFTGHQSHLKQILINEKFLQAFGYTIDSFISIVLMEGFPHLISMSGNINSDFLYDVLQHYVNTNDNQVCTPSYKCELLTKSGYLREAYIKIKFTIDVSKTNQEVDTIFVIMDTGSPYCCSQEYLEPNINQQFVDLVTAKELGMKEFIWKYYNCEIFPKYYNIDKFCKIKEISLHEEDIKQNPDESV